MATAAQITRVRALSNASVADFTDAAITLAIEEYPRNDSAGYHPDEDDWTATYDLYKAAADVAEQRAAKMATQYDTSADGATLNRSQIQEQLYALAVRLRSRGAAKAHYAIIEDNTEDGEDDDEGNT
jgi:hypothetical protein